MLSSESYSYDGAGNLSSKTVDGTTTSYTYDAIDQLLTESRTGYSASYTYDANGNRLTKTLGSSTDTYSYDSGDKLTSIVNSGVTTKSYTYDAAGRTTGVTTSSGTTTLGYDYEDRVTSISYPGGGSNSFTYNGLDTRVGKVDSSGTSTYRRDGADVTSPVLADGTANYTPGISRHTSSGTRFYGADYLGTNRVETDSTQTVQATRTFDAFGLLVSSTGTPRGPFGFVGKAGYQEDGDSGLKLLGHRYYDASTGRFLTRDRAKDGRNWYVYCRSNALKSVDPDGLGVIGVVFGGGIIIPYFLGSAAVAVEVDLDNGHIGIVGQGEAGTGSGLSAGFGGGFIGGQGSINGNSSSSGTGVVGATPIVAGEFDVDDNASHDVSGQGTVGIGTQWGPGSGAGVVKYKTWTWDITKSVCDGVSNGLKNLGNAVNGFNNWFWDHWPRVAI